MASFVVNLWESIFTPGPTPTLLIATNASFAALQLLFLALLIATHSIHFIILSILCAGLWYAINWFSAEIAAAQKAEDEAKRLRSREKDARKSAKEDDGEGDDEREHEGGVAGEDDRDDTEGGDTEVEKMVKKARTKVSSSSLKAARAPRPETQSTVFVERPSEAEMLEQARLREMREATPSASAQVGGATTGAKLAPGSAAEALKKRRSMGESTGELSTDSEWEKLSQEGEGEGR